MKERLARFLTILAVAAVLMAVLVEAEAYGGRKDELVLNHLSSYSTGMISPDGGVAEIVKYNPDNQKMYLVNGVSQTIDIVKINKNGTTFFNPAADRIDVRRMIPGFAFGDITSVDVNTKRKIIAIAVQGKDYSKPGAVLIMDYDGKLIKYVPTGVQPDMVTFTPDGQYILTADEGEPRAGYGPDAVDPKGSVTVIDLRKGVDKATPTIVTFDQFDGKYFRLLSNKVILKTLADPSRDLEPEYIAVTSDSKKAYVSLQEANSIAVLDIEKKEFTDIKGLGFKNHNLEKNALDVLKDKKISIETQGLYGVYMPDGIDIYEKKGKTYLLTANEGDAREWGDYANDDKKVIAGFSVDVLKNSAQDRLESEKTYIFGGRSFSIRDATTMEVVFDSGSDFEKIVAQQYPKNFNASNTDTKLDSRSGKKGPEPESVVVAYVGNQVYACVGLERIGGIMVYNITEPAKAYFVSYANVRDFNKDIAGDVSVEGLCFVSADKSPTGKPLLLAANEVSGTITIFEMQQSLR